MASNHKPHEPSNSHSRRPRSQGIEPSLYSSIDVPGQTHSSISPNGIIENDMNSKLVIVMVGLPARGKSYIAKKVLKYINWLQYSCRVFNVGNTRRSARHDELEEPETDTAHDASFFDHKNVKNAAKREEWAMDTLNDLLDWLIDGSGSVAIFDATNTTKQRRRKVYNHVKSRSSSINVLFLESICTNTELIEKNIRMKLSGPDYVTMNKAKALTDFKERLQNYERAYETIDPELETANEGEAGEDDLSYVKVINAGKKVISYNIKGFLSSQAVFYLLNINLTEKQIWLTRVGETDNDVDGIMGGDCHLTSLGKKYSKALAKFIKTKKKEFRLDQLNKAYINNVDVAHSRTNYDPDVSVFTSMTARALETAQYLEKNDQAGSRNSSVERKETNKVFQVKQLRMLNELSFGQFENTSVSDFRINSPKEFELYQHNKLLYRFPGVGGESYLDVINRVRPLITELERSDNHVLLITHKVITRILLAYFMNFDKELITDISIPSHSVYCLVPKPYGVSMEMYQYDETVDLFFRVPEEVMLRRGSVSTNSCSRPRFSLGGYPKYNIQDESVDEEDDDPFYSSSEEEEEYDEGVDDYSFQPRHQPSASFSSLNMQIEFRELSHSSVATLSDKGSLYRTPSSETAFAKLTPASSLPEDSGPIFKCESDESEYLLNSEVRQKLSRFVFQDVNV
ncbi:hypothetical protein BABINDRAFT_161640 [Babjeviella inositovora NRRL Y-12698]|uniref:6-phosphofructo-2-kinase domain-containing protein n=1 Tax=Babjeviella inositovora NRRL Y-12698 TaxID=984486 RepID=A0A1E3QQL5_9ASCO|nr:uncharacterized protein BABINDRAFT_161640 [Babjeviella inositovora NRRL Y-12698]ODQ79986.1 hypothetical protein BABINDRAFT_161640 [Babjeviella inositovora NRRL Y-12698]